MQLFVPKILHSTMAQNALIVKNILIYKKRNVQLVKDRILMI